MYIISHILNTSKFRPSPCVSMSIFMYVWLNVGFMVFMMANKDINESIYNIRILYAFEIGLLKIIIIIVMVTVIWLIKSLVGFSKKYCIRTSKCLL